jgi:hypothetical protein
LAARLRPMATDRPQWASIFVPCENVPVIRERVRGTPSCAHAARRGLRSRIRTSMCGTRWHPGSALDALFRDSPQHWRPQTADVFRACEHRAPPCPVDSARMSRKRRAFCKPVLACCATREVAPG